MFLERYFPISRREQIRDEFTRLTQRDDTVATYAETFISRPRFSPELVSSERETTRRLSRGLRESIRMIVVQCMGQTLDDVIDAAICQ